jgi:hypothetical protein
MMGVGVIGAVILGFVQDKKLDQNLSIYDQQHQTALHSDYVTQEKEGLFGAYKALDPAKLVVAPAETQQIINQVQNEAKKDALRTVALFPVLMLLCYLGLIFYFKAKGGYKPVILTEKESPA